MSPATTDIEERFARMPRSEQLLLLERLVRRLRQAELAESASVDDDLAAMAHDPEIQRELRQTDREFASADADGLEVSPCV